jgi:hypothetical protein
MLCAISAMLGPAIGSAGTRDEIRVYTDGIADPGEFELETHFNTIPRPRVSTTPIPGEPHATDGVIVTPELSYGLTRTLEAEVGFFWPFVRTDGPESFRISPELRLKWIPTRRDDDDNDDDDAPSRWFWGGVVEWSPSQVRPSDVRSFVDLRLILGWRHGDWLIAGNAIFEWPVAGGASRSPEFGPAIKVVRTLAPGFAMGLEYHGEYGKFNDWLPANEQLHTMYLTFDFAKPTYLHFGVGHGLNPQSGGWSLKGSLELPLN